MATNYDAWKTAPPGDEPQAPACFTCGSDLVGRYELDLCPICDAPACAEAGCTAGLLWDGSDFTICPVHDEGSA